MCFQNFFSKNYYGKTCFKIIYIYIYIYVRTQFVTTQNDIGFTRKKAQTISFVEHGFERLGLDH